MDKEELQQKIALYYSKLPPKVQEMFSSMSWMETLKTISEKYGLSEKQIETLGTETTLVLLGIINLDEYQKTLTTELALQREAADKIIAEINDSILKDVRGELSLIFNSNVESLTEEEPNIEQKLDKRFENLPEEIESIIEESNYQAILYGIAKGYNLTVIQMGILETAVTNLIVGAIHPDEFEDSLEINLRIPLETVRKIVDDINEKIFKKIREELIKNTERKKVFARSKENDGDDMEILNSAGIKIINEKPVRPNDSGHSVGETLPIPEKLELTTEPARMPKKEVYPVKSPELNRVADSIQQVAPLSRETHPILAQKISGSVKIPTVKTEYSLNNITKTNTPVPVNIKTKIPNVDPYREIPE